MFPGKKCPVQLHPGLCVCQCMEPIIHQGRISVYTGSSSIRVGGRLFTSPVKISGWHLVGGIVRAGQRDGFKLELGRGFLWYELGIYLAGCSGIAFEVRFSFLPTTGRVLVIQHFFRRILEARRARRARLLAVALCTLPRLGVLSPFALLPLELLLERFCGMGSST
jgi:hypothetical protein